MNDELDRVRDVRPPVSAPSRRLVDTERNRLMSLIERESHQESKGAGRHKKRWVLPGFAVATLATAAAAAGYAVTRDVATTTQISCPANTVIDAVTGDPVADCADLWRQQHGTEPPELAAYDNQRGGIQVVPADAEVPSEWTPLEEGYSQDARLIELDAALADYGDGLNAECYSPEDARSIAQNTLARLSLDPWSVRIDEDRSGGDRACAVHRLDAEANEVVIFPLDTGRPSQDAPFRDLAASVQTHVDGSCLDRTEAVAVVRRIAADMDIDEAAGELVIHSVPDATAACSRTDVNVGGRIEVTVRGR